MKKAAVIGPYGLGEDFATGQAVKAYTVVNWLKGRLGEEDILVVNTYQWKRRPFRLLFNTLRALCECRNVIMLPSQNGVQIFVPLVGAANRLFHRDIHYIVVGGSLRKMLEEKRWMLRYIRRFSGVYSESSILKAELETLGLSNVFYLPNCRDPEDAPIPPRRDSLPLNVCTYSRVTKDKGILDAIEICRLANELLEKDIFHLDVYGAIAPEFQAEFQAACRENRAFVRYCGVKDANEAQAVLRQYFALLFPTYYPGECLAGTILEAFAASLPVIASDWRFNPEFIRDGENGFLYPCHDNSAAAEKLAALYRSETLYRSVCEGCRADAENYSTDRVLGEFLKRLR